MFENCDLNVQIKYRGLTNERFQKWPDRSQVDFVKNFKQWSKVLSHRAVDRYDRLHIGIVKKR